MSYALLLNDNLRNPKMIKNLEQIKYLQQYVQDEKNKKKFGKWRAAWRGEETLNVGGYIKEGKKQGFWKELIENYWSQAQVYEKGRYKNNLRIGQWSYILQEKKIGGGLYNQEGLKTGKWVELFLNFYIKNQVFQIGEYINGKKVGKWIMIMNDDQINKQIVDSGGGYYNNNNLKQGYWTELNENYHKYNQVTHQGFYYNDQKVGKWMTYLNEKKKKLIGRGSYVENNLKNGKWIELIDNFQCYRNENIFQGEYKNGQKLGIIYNKGLKKCCSQIEINNIFLLINGIQWVRNRKLCGGLFNQQGQQNGLWNEMSYGHLKEDENIMYQGEYQNSKKIGFWTIQFRGKYIGGGKYNQSFQRNGKWIEPDHGFLARFFEATWNGEYNKKQKNLQMDNSMGRRRIVKINCDYYKLSGGGYFDYLNMKQAKWVEMDEDFHEESQVTHRGYYKNGKKIGKWDTYFFKELIGGGSYDENSLKNGQWIDLIDNIYSENEITLQGEYRNGQKVGRWTYQLDEQQIGGGSYNQQGQKRGQWIELCDDFIKYHNQVSFKGFYKNNKKVGKWIEIKGGLHLKQYLCQQTLS